MDAGAGVRHLSPARPHRPRAEPVRPRRHRQPGPGRAGRPPPGRVPAAGDGERAALRRRLAVRGAGADGRRALRHGAGERHPAEHAAAAAVRLSGLRARSRGAPGVVGLASALARAAVDRPLGARRGAGAGGGGQPAPRAVHPPPGPLRGRRAGAAGGGGDRERDGGLRAGLAARAAPRIRCAGAGRRPRRGAGPRGGARHALRGRAGGLHRHRPRGGAGRQGHGAGGAGGARGRGGPVRAADGARGGERGARGLGGARGRRRGGRAPAAVPPRGRRAAGRALHGHGDLPPPPGRALAGDGGRRRGPGAAAGRAAGRRGGAGEAGWAAGVLHLFAGARGERVADRDVPGGPFGLDAGAARGGGGRRAAGRGGAPVRAAADRQGVDGAFAARLRRAA